MEPQHPLDMWYEHAGEANESPPFCSRTSVDCWSNFPSNTTEQAKVLARRLTCVSGVLVPEYYVETMSNMSTDFVTHGSNGTMFFSAKVCQCNPVHLLTGKDCTPSSFGYAILVACIAVWLWVLGLFLRALSLMKSGKLESRKKKILVVLAALQYLSQLVWIAGWFNVYFIESHALLTSFQDVGFTFASLFMFMFICGMVNQTAQFLHEGVKKTEANLEKQLRWIQRIFGTLPHIVALLTGFLAPIASAFARFLLLSIQYLILIAVTIAFNFTIGVLNKKVNRLVPEAARPVKKTIAGRLKRLHRAVGRQISSMRQSPARPDQTTLDLLASSQRLCSMAVSLRNALICYMLIGGAFFAADVVQDSSSAFFVIVFFLIMQLFLNAVPVVGVGGLSSMKPIVTLARHVTHQNVIPKRMDVTDEDMSSYGTLTS